MLFIKWKELTNNTNMLSTCILAIILLIQFVNGENVIDEFDTSSGLYSIEGKVYPPEIYSPGDVDWQRDTVITINDGEYSGFLKSDGIFSITGVPSGSYVVEVTHPDYYYNWVGTINIHTYFDSSRKFNFKMKTK